MKGKTTGQTPNNFTILNRDYNRDTTWVKKNSLFLFTHCSLPHCVFSLTLFIFLLCLLSLTQLFKTTPSPHTLGLHFFFPSGASHLHPLGLHFFSPSSLAEWPLYLFLHLFLLFSLSHSSYQVTINASQLILTLLQQISFLQLSLSWMTLAFCFFLFFLPSNVSHKFNITYSFMWLDFCTSLHKCCSTFVHNYRGKDEPNFFSFGQASPASSICFAGFLPIFQQAHLMS